MNPTIPSNDATVETDADLLAIASFKGEALEESNAAFAKFYNLYAPFLLSYISYHCRKHRNKIIAEEVFSATIQKVYTYSHKFSTKGEKNPVIVCRMIKGWLGTIARHEYLNLIGGMKIEKEQFKEYETLIIAQAKTKNASIKESPHSQAIRDALNSLPNRDKEVFLTYLEYQKDGKNLPKEATKMICDLFEITDANRRQIITRSRKKVYDYLESKGLNNTL